MSKADEVEAAIERLRHAWTPGVGNSLDALVVHELTLMYDTGHNQGLIDADTKLDEALEGLKRGNDKLAQVIRERDAILEEYARVSWAKVAEGLLRNGFHPPTAHKNEMFAKKFGPGPCKKCKEDMVLWDAMPEEAKKKKMEKVWSAVMQVRARRVIEKGGFSIVNAPTTQELGGAAKPSQPSTEEPSDTGS